MSNTILKLWVAADQPDSSWTWAKTVQEAKAAIKSFSIYNPKDTTLIICIGEYGYQHPVHNQFYLDFLCWLERYNPFSDTTKVCLNFNDAFELFRARSIVNYNWKEADYNEYM